MLERKDKGALWLLANYRNEYLEILTQNKYSARLYEGSWKPMGQ